MSLESRIPQGSLLFAPMEGVTDEAYRLAMASAFPEWDLFSTDFLRIPKESHYSTQKVMNHFGKKVFNNPLLKEKTTYQILTSPEATTEPTVSKIQDLGFTHLDLNLGCPSKRVNSHHGGAWLLSDVKILKDLLVPIRKTFKGLFTVKIRIGYRDDKNFEKLLKMFEQEGIDGITLHARTRDQLYKGQADWSYIKKAVEMTSIPIIGNGDLWHAKDIKRMLDETGCHAVMLGRGALKTPWMPLIYHKYKDRFEYLDDDDLLFERKKYLDLYFYQLEKEFQNIGMPEMNILRRFKSFSHHLFDDYDQPDLIRGNFLRAETLDEFLGHLENLN